MPGFVGPPPAALAVVLVGQGVYNRVQIRAYVEAQVLKVVAGVYRNSEVAGLRNKIVQAAGKFGAADTATQGQHTFGLVKGRWAVIGHCAGPRS